MDAFQVLDQLELVYRPFDSIPNELLALILIWTSCMLEREQQRFTFPITIPQLVSHRWRDVALATPSLWTTFHVTKKMSNASLESYLQRSGNMALDLKVSNDSLPLAPVTHSSRWARVTLWSDNENRVDEIIEKISPHAMSLRHFCCIFPLPPFARIYLARIGSLCPNLESLHLTNVLPNWGTATLSFRDLTELVIRAGGLDGEIKIEGLLETLRASPRLRYLELVNIEVPEDISPQLLANRRGIAIELDSLEKLVLTSLYIAEFLFFSSQLNCPNLQSLGVGLIDYEGNDPRPEADWSPLSPVYPHLQRLDLWSLKIAPEQLRFALRHITSISYLAIRGCEAFYFDKHLAQTFSVFKPTIHTLKTYSVDVPTLYLLFNHFFPRTETIYMHWKDVDVIIQSGEPSLGFMSAYGKLPKVVLWGEGEGDVWFLERVEEREIRIGNAFRTSILD